VLALGAPGPSATQQVASALVAFAPGLIGYGLLAHLTRACYAAHRCSHIACQAIEAWIRCVDGDKDRRARCGKRGALEPVQNGRRKVTAKGHGAKLPQ
jgi:hypothetical protein